MTNEEAAELRAELKDLRAQSTALMQFCHELYTSGASEIAKPTDPMLGLVADLFELRCSDRDCLVQRLEEALGMVRR